MAISGNDLLELPIISPFLGYVRAMERNISTKCGLIWYLLFRVLNWPLIQRNPAAIELRIENVWGSSENNGNIGIQLGYN